MYGKVCWEKQERNKKQKQKNKKQNKNHYPTKKIDCKQMDIIFITYITRVHLYYYFQIWEPKHTFWFMVKSHWKQQFPLDQS